MKKFNFIIIIIIIIISFIIITQITCLDCEGIGLDYYKMQSHVYITGKVIDKDTGENIQGYSLYTADIPTRFSYNYEINITDEGFVIGFPYEEIEAYNYDSSVCGTYYLSNYSISSSYLPKSLVVLALNDDVYGIVCYTLNPTYEFTDDDILYFQQHDIIIEMKKTTYELVISGKITDKTYSKDIEGLNVSYNDEFTTQTDSAGNYSLTLVLNKKITECVLDIEDIDGTDNLGDFGTTTYNISSFRMLDKELLMNLSDTTNSQIRIEMSGTDISLEKI